MGNEPIRHHYIPQFILKNFCFNKRGDLHYHDIKTSKSSIKNVRDIFMSENLYRDENNNSDRPTKSESDFAAYECEVSKIIKEKFLFIDDVQLSTEEDEKLKLFFALMGFRSKHTSDKFGLNAPDVNKKFYSLFQKDGDLAALWKRNLGYIVNCRSFAEVLNHKNIDEPFKIFMRRDTLGLFGQYFILTERRSGTEQFVISDAYPVVVNGFITQIPLHLYSIFTISPDRAILLASTGVEGAPSDVTCFRKCVFTPPKTNPNDNSIRIRFKRLYEEEVKYINSALIKNACEGYVFQKKKL